MRDLMTLQERMNRLFEDAADRQTPTDEAAENEIERADWFPAADVYETDMEFTIVLDLPGVERERLDIGLDENRLTIRGERAVAAPEGSNQRRTERPNGRFLRRFSLPDVVDREAIAADYKDGVLRLHLPKRREPGARRLEIKVS
jgi:HSP20 family protein